MKIESLRQSANTLGISLRTLYNRVDDGSLPRPLQISKRRRGYLDTTLQQIMEDAASEAAALDAAAAEINGVQK